MRLLCLLIWQLILVFRYERRETLPAYSIKGIAKRLPRNKQPTHAQVYQFTRFVGEIYNKQGVMPFFPRGFEIGDFLIEVETDTLR